MDTETGRRGFLARAAALAAVPTLGALIADTMAAPPAAAAAADDGLPDYAPVPASSLGPALNAQGYFVGLINRNLYWVTDGQYSSAFLTTRDGVVLFDAPASIGHNLQRAIDDVTRPSGLTNKVTHVVYSHHHADHIDASGLFGTDVTRIGHTETRRLLLLENDPNRPAPDVTFDDKRVLHIGGERISLAWHGSNHTPDTIFIHLPDHDTLMLIDVVLPGWAPFENLNLCADIPGTLAAPAIALQYPWKTFIGGHLGRLGDRRDLQVHQAYMADLNASVLAAMASVDPTPYFIRYGDNPWAALKVYLDKASEVAAEPVVQKYIDLLGAVDVFTQSNALMLIESIRLDNGVDVAIHG